MNEFYVYQYRDPITKSIRYIGKGKGNRYLPNSHNHGYCGNWINSLKKQGMKPIIEFPEKDLTEKEAFALERKLIKRAKEEGHPLTNLTDGGEGLSGFKHSEESKKKMSELAIGKTHTDETKKKLSISGKGRPGFWTGKSLSEDHKNRLSESHKGYTMPESQKEKIAIANMGKKGTTNVSVEIYEKNTGKFVGKWNSLTSCAKDLGVQIASICHNLKGRSKSFSKYIAREAS